MKVVVAGGTGFLGTPLVSQLRNSGNDVAVLTRRSAGPGQIMSGMQRLLLLLDNRAIMSSRSHSWSRLLAP